MQYVLRTQHLLRYRHRQDDFDRGAHRKTNRAFPLAPTSQTKAERAPWLRRSKNSSGAEEIRVVDLDRKVERPATPEEIESGIEYRDYDAYMKGNAA
jgi:hypothetical protein